MAERKKPRRRITRGDTFTFYRDDKTGEEGVRCLFCSAHARTLAARLSEAGRGGGAVTVWHTDRWIKMPVFEPLDLLACSWQARGLYRILQTRMNADGHLALGKQGLPNLALAVGAKWEEIENYVQELINAGFLVQESDGVSDPFFHEKQRAVSSESGNAETHRVERGEEKREKKKPGRPPGDARHRPMIDLFFNLWAELRGGDKYETQTADVASVSRFLKSHPDTTLEEMERRMRLAFADRWFLQNGTLAHFISRWANFDRVVGFPGGTASKPRPRAIGVDASGQVIWETK
jgi:hypothetical protein